MRVLLTGAAGSIGRVLTVGLADRGHTVIGLDRVPAPSGFADADWHTADCTDIDAVLAVFESERSRGGIDAVVHMAGHPGEAGLVAALESHVITTGALLDAMVAHGVSRFVYGSSNHAVGFTPRPDDGAQVTVATRPRPDTFYGVGKVAAEALMSLYADRHGIDAVACRIGSFLHEPTTSRQLATWLSHDDCVRMIDAALTATTPGFAVLYGISANGQAWWDFAAGQALGFEPVDNADEFAAQISTRPEDAHENAFIGGPFTDSSVVRPALDRSE